jgi:hypothetical protein
MVFNRSPERLKYSTIVTQSIDDEPTNKLEKDGSKASVLDSVINMDSTTAVKEQQKVAEQGKTPDVVLYNVIEDEINEDLTNIG